MGSRYEGATHEVRALDTHVKLVRAASSVADRIAASLSASRIGITESQLAVLEALFHLGPLGQHELGTKLSTSRPNVTLLVDALEGRRLVRRERSTADRRCVTVHLTARGRALIARRFPEHVARIVEVYSALTAEEQLELGRLCKKLGLAARAAADQGPA